MILQRFNGSGEHVAISTVFGWTVFARYQLKPDGQRVRVSNVAVMRKMRPTDPNDAVFLPRWMRPC